LQKIPGIYKTPDKTRIQAKGYIIKLLIGGGLFSKLVTINYFQTRRNKILKTFTSNPKMMLLLIPITLVISIGLALAPATANAADEFELFEGSTSIGTFDSIEEAIDEILTDVTLLHTSSYTVVCDLDDVLPYGLVIDDTVNGYNVTIKSVAGSTYKVTLDTANSTDRHFTVDLGASLTLENIIISGDEDDSGDSDGGGITVINGGSLTLNRGAVIEFCYDDAASNGGGVHVGNGNEFTMNGDSIIRNCSAAANNTGEGGGVYGEINAKITLNNNAAITACAADEGGAIYLNDGAELTMNGGSITDNIASDGGGIYSEGGDIIIAYCLISDNEATDDGGGIYVDINSTLKVRTDVEFLDNTAGGDGGAICAEDLNNIETHRTTIFAGNVADEPRRYDGNPAYTLIRFDRVSTHFPLEDKLPDHAVNNFDINNDSGRAFEPFSLFLVQFQDENGAELASPLLVAVEVDDELDITPVDIAGFSFFDYSSVPGYYNLQNLIALTNISADYFTGDVNVLRGIRTGAVTHLSPELGDPDFSLVFVYTVNPLPPKSGE
jgi:predicted outer membrane repeat protein